MRKNVFEFRAGGLSKEQLLEQLADCGISLNDYARQLFDDDDFVTSAEAYDVSAVAVTLPNLGLPAGGTYAEIVAQARRLGLSECSLEVAPHLRLHLLEQEEGPYLTVASPQLCDDPSMPNGFYLRRLEGRLWLRGYEAGPEVVYEPDFTEFVFERAAPDGL